jgi:NAD(P)-dependent dehydrogenase (short-subunit alcohol dehydrogenase family)
MGLFSQTAIPPLAPSSTLRSQAVMITGATGGIGYELSLQVLRLGATDLILAVRSLQKGSAARLELLADEQVRANNPAANIRVYELDLGDYDSVSTCATRILREEKKLDVLVLNAGINLAHFERSASGYEM